MAALGIDTFGESAPAADLYRHFGLTPADIARRADAGARRAPRARAREALAA